MQGDSRRFKREEVYNKVLINGEVIGYIHDVSLGGLRVAVIMPEVIELKEKVEIKILCNDIIGENINLIGEIKWQKVEGLFKYYGIEFKEFKSEIGELINKYINYATDVDLDPSGIVIEISEVE